MEFSGSTEGIIKRVVDFFIVGRGIVCESLLGGRSACCLAAVLIPWEAFPVCNLDSGRLVGWCFLLNGKILRRISAMLAFWSECFWRTGVSLM